MIPDYPNFVPLNLNHKGLVEAIASNYEPYSDFNFASLYCWNTDNTSELSWLNGNLVIKIPDYLTGKPCYSLLGESHIDASLSLLLQNHNILNFIPEAVIKHIKYPEKFVITEDPDHFDYVYSLAEHATFPGQKFRDQRKKMNRFLTDYGDAVQMIVIDFSNEEQTANLRRTFAGWAKEKLKDDVNIMLEKQAIDRLIDQARHHNVIGLELLIEGEAAGFSIVEKASGGYAVFHFHKALTSNKGADVYLTSKVSEYLLHEGCLLINWEQDMGLPGLRYSKMHYRPIKMLKKYQLTLAT